MFRYASLLLLTGMLLVGCSKSATHSLTVEVREHGFDFVDGSGCLIGTATNLDRIGTVLDLDEVQSLLTKTDLEIQFFRQYVNGQRLKGFEMPEPMPLNEITDFITKELKERGLSTNGLEPEP